MLKEEKEKLKDEPENAFMGEPLKVEKRDTHHQEGGQHVRKFTEGLLNSAPILAALDIAAGQTVVDAGCGNGYMAKVFSTAVARSGKVYAVDPDRHFIAILRAETKGTNIETLEGDITIPTGIPSSSVDVLYLSTVVHLFSRPQMQGFVREAERILKPDARLAIVEIEKRETPFGPPLHLRYSPQELIEAISMIPEKTLAVGDHFYMQVFRNGGIAIAPDRESNR